MVASSRAPLRGQSRSSTEVAKCCILWVVACSCFSAELFSVVLGLCSGSRLGFALCLALASSGLQFVLRGLSLCRR
jgi:hypothetical protein